MPVICLVRSSKYDFFRICVRVADIAFPRDQNGSQISIDSDILSAQHSSEFEGLNDIKAYPQACAIEDEPTHALTRRCR